MALRQSADPYGYKKLLVYTKAEELQRECARLTAQFPKEKTLIALADQMDRSARSVKQNIVEGSIRIKKSHTIFWIASQARKDEIPTLLRMIHDNPKSVGA